MRTNCHPNDIVFRNIEQSEIKKPYVSIDDTFISVKKSSFYGFGKWSYIKKIEEPAYSISPLKVNRGAKFYGGGEISLIDSSSLKKLEIKRTEVETDFLVKRKSLVSSFKEILVDYVGNSEDITIENYNELAFMHELAHKYISSFLLDNLNGDERLDNFIKELESVENCKRVLKVLNDRIKNILNSISEYFRNLKEVFWQNHSFHFKNLDDYHSRYLVNRLAVS